MPLTDAQLADLAHELGVSRAQTLLGPDATVTPDDAVRALRLSDLDRLKGVSSAPIDNTRPVSEYIVIPPGWTLDEVRAYERILTDEEIDKLETDRWTLVQDDHQPSADSE